MHKEEIISIAVKVSEGTATSDEIAMYINHIDSFIKEYPEWESLDVENKQSIEAQLRSDIQAQIKKGQAKLGFDRLWPRMIGIAAAVALVVFGVYFFNYRNDSYSDSTVLAKHDATPGTVGATLTLANGKKIKLSDAANGEIAKEAGISVTKTADGQLVYQVVDTSDELNKTNTLSTAKGETYRVRLPDGSLVWLNAASSLTYSTNIIEDGFRTVVLTGEAYFEVSKDKAHPFIVKSKGQEVKVLGTRFNISSYTDDNNVKTTLLEGSVQVNNMLLKPNEQSVLENHQIRVIPVDAEKIVAWKNGKFVFTSESIKSIMTKLSRWYNVEVIYNGNVDNEVFTGSMSRYDDISKILETISFTQAVHFKIEGRRITVMP
jgi:transmembrane sensor